VPVWNPAFDVTPADLITSWVTESGVVVRDDNGVVG
jgi:methylthioribose-1-phosphate isomerase